MTPSPEQIAKLDALLASWRQGDVVIGDTIPFVHLADLTFPTTPVAAQLAVEGASGVEIVPAQAQGFVVLTQTCELVRPYTERPYVEVSPLVTVPPYRIGHVRRNRIPRFLPLPGLDDPSMAGDLDRVMTLEKRLLASLTAQRIKGVNTDSEAQILAEVLGRKRMRPAFPDDFVAAVDDMRRRITDKCGKASPEGRFLDSVSEIRVRSIPDWTAAIIELEFLFIFERGASIPTDAGNWVNELLKRIATGSWIAAVEGRAVGLDQLSAATYIDSYRLDLDHLSYGA